MSRLRATHRTEITYAGSARDSVNEVRLIPVADARQQVEDPYIHVEPATVVFLHTDAFGNHVAWFQVEAPHERLVIEATSTVQIAPAPARPTGVAAWEALDDPDIRNAVGEYLLDSPRVPQSDAVAAFADEVAGDPAADVVAWLAHIERAIHEAITYQPGSTKVDSTVDHMLSLRRGVCQDMAHLFLALCRRRGVPARYVSGWHHEPGRVAPHESHSWCEAWIHGTGWVEYDPTNPEPALEHYVRVGVGRDYSDVPPVRGHYVGAVTEDMTVTVNLVPVPDA